MLSAVLAVVLAGTSWEAPAPGLSYPAAFVVAAGGGETLYAFGAGAAPQGGVFRSTDRAGSWEEIAEAPPAEYYVGLWGDPFHGERLFAATIHPGFAYFTTRIYRSSDGGETWSMRSSLLDAHASGGSVAFDPSRPDSLYVSYNAGAFFRSDDGGETFLGLSVPFAGVFLEVALDGAVFAVAQSAIFVSRDRGEHWSQVAVPEASCPEFSALAIDPSDSNRMFLGTAMQDVACGEIFRSLDGGATWSETAPASIQGPVLDLVIDPFHPRSVYAATFVGEPGERSGRVLASSDGGEHWRDLALPTPTGASQLALAEEGRRLYAVTPAGVYARELRRSREIPTRTGHGGG